MFEDNKDPNALSEEAQKAYKKINDESNKFCNEISEFAIDKLAVFISELDNPSFEIKQGVEFSLMFAVAMHFSALTVSSLRDEYVEWFINHFTKHLRLIHKEMKEDESKE